MKRTVSQAVSDVEANYGSTKIGKMLAAAAPYRAAVIAAEESLAAAIRRKAPTAEQIELCRAVLRCREEHTDMVEYGKILQPSQRRALGRR